MFPISLFGFEGAVRFQLVSEISYLSKCVICAIEYRPSVRPQAISAFSSEKPKSILASILPSFISNDHFLLLVICLS